jgi:hypothetical protein
MGDRQERTEGASRDFATAGARRMNAAREAI